MPRVIQVVGEEIGHEVHSIQVCRLVEVTCIELVLLARLHERVVVTRRCHDAQLLHSGFFEHGDRSDN
jgi:hypothetical protein